MDIGRFKVRKHNKKTQIDEIIKEYIHLNKSPFYHTGMSIILNIDKINEYDTNLANKLHIKLIKLIINELYTMGAMG